MKSDYRNDRAWADSFEGQVTSIIARNLAHIVTIEVATRYEDNKHATDMVVKTSGRGDIGVRLRRSEYKQRDLTIRAKRSSGTETELAKVSKGWATHYLYGWTTDDLITEWALVDMDEVRRQNLLVGREEIANRDGTTSFIAIPISELDEKGCIVNRRMNR